MKNKKISSILCSLLALSFALIPVSLVFADDSTSTDSTSVATSTTASSTRMIRAGERNFRGMPPAFSSSSLNRPANWKNASTTRPGFRYGSSTASSTMMRHPIFDQFGINFKMNIASSTQNLLDVADKLGTLSDQIKTLVADEASSTNTIAAAVTKVDSRNPFENFLIGPDYSNLNSIMNQINMLQAEITQLTGQISGVASSTDKTTALTDIQNLKDQMSSLNQYVKNNNSKFSLFGWFVKKFNK